MKNRVLATLLGSVLLLVPAVAQTQNSPKSKPASCCTAQAACCKPPSACCAPGQMTHNSKAVPVKNQQDAKTSCCSPQMTGVDAKAQAETKDQSCCTPGAACCTPGAACCK